MIRRTSKHVRLAFRAWRGEVLLFFALVLASQSLCLSNDDVDAAPDALIGYTEFRTDLSLGRHANVCTMRARLVRADGVGRREIADNLAREPNTWTQFAGWSPDGNRAIVGCGWESSENAKWEEEHERFRFTPDGWRYDMYLLHVRGVIRQNGKGGSKPINLTAIDRVSFYNTGLFFWPNDANTLGFQALIDGVSHPFRMDGDGRNKRDLTAGSKGFAYGFGASPDGKRIAYHKDYQVYVADADGSNVSHVRTDKPFNFSPRWSPDGKRLLFVAGEHYNCHPYVVRRDGTGLRKVGDRGTYRGVVAFLDVPDFHGGSSDTPVWSSDSRTIFYTARIGKSVELMRATLEGAAEQLTHTKPGSLNYHPHVSPNGEWLAFGSTRSGTRQLYVMHTKGRKQHAITSVKPGSGAMWPHWQPRPVDRAD